MASIDHIGVELTIVIGETTMPLQRVMSLGRGAMIPLGKNPSAPLSIQANGRRIGAGRVALDGEKVSVSFSREMT